MNTFTSLLMLLVMSSFAQASVLSVTADFPGSAAAVSGATITTNEAGLDTIFSQQSFVDAGNTIDIRFNPTVTIFDNSLLNVGDSQTWTALTSSRPGTAPVVNMYFVDTIDWCGNFNTSIVGCAFTPGNDLVVESGFAAGGSGAELLAHELVHNLGLGHTAGFNNNLMNGSINGNTTLTLAQATSILGSNLIQLDGTTRFIEITPVLISAVPLPASLLLALSGFGSLGLFGKFKRQSAAA